MGTNPRKIIYIYIQCIHIYKNKTLISLKTSFVGTKMDINDAND